MTWIVKVDAFLRSIVLANAVGLLEKILVAFVQAQTPRVQIAWILWRATIIRMQRCTMQPSVFTWIVQGFAEGRNEQILVAFAAAMEKAVDRSRDALMKAHATSIPLRKRTMARVHILLRLTTARVRVYYD